MLTQIYCSAFGEDKTIRFGPGLNVIQGYSGEIAKHNGNSIGKSSFLKIIDYALGGDYYANSNDDIIDHVGDHDICFTHTFKDTHLYFRRNAKKYKKVYYCDKDYVPQTEHSVEEFQDLLLQYYGLKDRSLTLRQMIGLYIRVWNKPNKEVDRPLFKYNSQTINSAIIDLIKLFNQYNSISELEQQNNYLLKRQKALNTAITYHLLDLPKSNNEYQRLLYELKDLDNEIELLKTNISVFNVQNTSIINENYNALLEIRGDLLKEQGRCQREIRRNEINLKSIQPVDMATFMQLTEYFPEINLQRLEEVQGFHNSLRHILKEELQLENNRLIEKLESINISIVKNDNEIKSTTGLPTQASEAFDLLYKKIKQREKLQERAELFNDKIADRGQKEKNSEILTELLDGITQDIQTKVNDKIETLSLAIDTSNNKAPSLELTPTNYTFGVKDNTGTGKAYTDLLLFDLAILAITDLPVLLHDSFLFNNIDNKTIQNIIKIYNQHTKKQVFIALDKYLGSDDEEVDEILRIKTRLFLSGSKTLFGIDWRT